MILIINKIFKFLKRDLLTWSEFSKLSLCFELRLIIILKFKQGYRLFITFNKSGSINQLISKMKGADYS